MTDQELIVYRIEKLEEIADKVDARFDRMTSAIENLTSELTKLRTERNTFTKVAVWLVSTALAILGLKALF